LPALVVPLGFGVNIHFTDPAPVEMARFAEAGYRRARMDLAWAAVRHTDALFLGLPERETAVLRQGRQRFKSRRSDLTPGLARLA
jgi:hypothetical protein